MRWARRRRRRSAECCCLRCGPSIASGVTLGIGRIVGDTAIVVILLGATIAPEGAGGRRCLSILRGTGGTLTSYVRYNSPAGEGNAHEKAYAAAFVLLLMVLALNVIVMRLSSGAPSGRGSEAAVDPLMAPPVRRIAAHMPTRPWWRLRANGTADDPAADRRRCPDPRRRPRAPDLSTAHVARRRRAAIAASRAARAALPRTRRRSSACGSKGCGWPTASGGWCAT